MLRVKSVLPAESITMETPKIPEAAWTETGASPGMVNDSYAPTSRHPLGTGVLERKRRLAR